MTSAPEYDPNERRDTPLAAKLAATIRANGPITVADYMRACLLDPEHGYYVRQQAIGASGDFITAPEISQVFGELLGLWSVVVWQQMGAPARFDLVELGPGRGTMMADALRAASLAPDFLAAARVRLIEVNPLLRQAQRATLARSKVPIEWSAWLADCAPFLPSIVLGNEYLDVEPVEQTVEIAGLPFVRCVAIDGSGRLTFVQRARDGGHLLPDTVGGIREHRATGASFANELMALPVVAALFIDYGHPGTTSGDTLQAVRGHRFEHPLTSPGEADLTAQVDFGAVATAARSAGLTVDGPITQAEFLGALGISHRGSRLMSANPARALEIETGIARLMSPEGMGTRFKVIGIRSQQMPPLPGFPPAA
jgi:NADH dehydrogenase [ubiquinone] 1 alpha subcomplex assembly factor 7